MMATRPPPVMPMTSQMTIHRQAKSANKKIRLFGVIMQLVYRHQSASIACNRAVVAVIFNRLQSMHPIHFQPGVPPFNRPQMHQSMHLPLASDVPKVLPYPVTNHHRPSTPIQHHRMAETITATQQAPIRTPSPSAIISTSKCKISTVTTRKIT